MLRIHSFVLGLACLLPWYLSAQEIHLSEDDNGKTVTVTLDDLMIITLEGHPTTGFSWEIDSMDGQKLNALGRWYTSVNPQKVFGAGGYFTFKFQPLAQGSSLLSLKYVRPWEKLPPLRTFSVTVTMGRS